jgi:hypothetical protein
VEPEEIFLLQKICVLTYFMDTIHPNSLRDILPGPDQKKSIQSRRKGINILCIGVLFSVVCCKRSELCPVFGRKEVYFRTEREMVFC